MNEMSPNSNKEDFILLYSKEQKRIYLFILSMVSCKADADDIMQQTAVAMWKLFDRFEEGTDFVAWGRAIAKYQALNFRRQQGRSHLALSDEISEKVIRELGELEKSGDKRRDALQGCLKKLAAPDRKLLALHYEDSLTYKKIAEDLNLSRTGIYKVMARIHKNLHRCVRRTLLVWETNG